MIKRLSPCLAYDQQETLLSWCHRLAHFHTKGSTADFLGDLGMSLATVVRSTNVTALRLCELTGQSPDPVLFHGLTTDESRGRILRGEPISMRLLTGPSTKFCPQCLLGDLHAGRGLRHRSHWNLRPFWCCPEHDVLLTSYDHTNGSTVAHDLGEITGAYRRNVYQRADAAVSAAPSSLQRYLERRLRAEPQGEWLDGVAIDELVAGVETIGVTLMFGPAERRQRLSATQLIEASNVAWPYVMQGEAGLLAAFSEMKSGRAKRPECLHRRRSAAYGEVYGWCHRAIELNSSHHFASALRKHIIENDDVAPGEEVLGEVVKTPSWSSIASLVRRTGIRRNDIAVYPDIEKVGRNLSAVLLDRKSYEPIILELKSAHPRDDVFRALEVDKDTGGELLKQNAISLIQNGRFRGDRISAESVSDFFKFIRKNFARGSEVPAGSVQLRSLFPTLKYPKEIFVTGLLHGYVSGVLPIKGRLSLGAILVEPKVVDELPREMPAELTGYWFG